MSLPFPSAWRQPVAAVALAMAATTAAAVELPYSFLTTGASYGNVPGPVQAFDPMAGVSGQFLYDPTRPPGGTLSNGATRYDRSFMSSSGTVQGLGFSDPFGYTAVGNNLQALGGNDLLMLAAEPGLGTGTHNLVGFAIDGWTLVNVRLFWMTGMSGIGDFLGSDALPAALPGFAGRLALDFVPTGSTTTVFSTVFFDGMTVTVVPEPGAAALMAAGLLGLAGLRVRRRQARPAD